MLFKLFANYKCLQRIYKLKNYFNHKFQIFLNLEEKEFSENISCGSKNVGCIRTRKSNFSPRKFILPIKIF